MHDSSARGPRGPSVRVRPVPRIRSDGFWTSDLTRAGGRGNTGDSGKRSDGERAGGVENVHDVGGSKIKEMVSGEEEGFEWF